MRWPSVAILIVTYFRPSEIRQTINALLRNLVYDGPLSWHICDDGSPHHYLQQIVTDYSSLGISVTITKRQGWGANVNKGLASCLKSKYMFLAEDDQVLQKRLDITKGVALMEIDPSIGLVRYDGIAGHKLTLDLLEATTQKGKVAYFNILKSSSALNVYSNRPHLRSRRFNVMYGEYRTDLSLGETESNYAHRVKDKKGPKIVCFPEDVYRVFKHIGKTQQRTANDTNYKARTDK